MESLSASEILAGRVRGRLAGRAVTAKRMFGGLTFMLAGNMLCCVSAKGLMVRVGADQEAEALQRPFAGRCLGAGRPMAGFILVSPEGVADDGDLEGWLGRALAYVSQLPAKA
jgi:hypothetical protein